MSESCNNENKSDDEENEDLLFELLNSLNGIEKCFVSSDKVLNRGTSVNVKPEDSKKPRLCESLVVANDIVEVNLENRSRKTIINESRSKIFEKLILKELDKIQSSKKQKNLETVSFRDKNICSSDHSNECLNDENEKRLISENLELEQMHKNNEYEEALKFLCEQNSFYKTGIGSFRNTTNVTENSSWIKSNREYSRTSNIDFTLDSNVISINNYNQTLSEQVSTVSSPNYYVDPYVNNMHNYDYCMAWFQIKGVSNPSFHSETSTALSNHTLQRNIPVQVTRGNSGKNVTESLLDVQKSFSKKIIQNVTNFHSVISRETQIDLNDDNQSKDKLRSIQQKYEAETKINEKIELESLIVKKAKKKKKKKRKKLNKMKADIMGIFNLHFSKVKKARNKACFRCGQTDHISKICTAPTPIITAASGKSKINKKVKKPCFRCKQTDHYARDCPASAPIL